MMIKPRNPYTLFRRFLSSFRRLQWKLTLAYALSTLLTVLILASIGLGLLWYINFRSNLMPNLIATSMASVIPSPAGYLGPTPDRNGLKTWVREVTPGDYLTLRIPRNDTEDPSDTVPAQLGQVTLLVVVDAGGQVVAAQPAEMMEPVQPLVAYLSPGEVSRLEAALQGETEPSLLSGREAGGYMIAATPLFDDNRQVVGAMFARLTYPMGESEFIRGVLQGAILPVAVAMLVAGLVAGVLFGFLIARYFSRRLSKLAEAADVWSQGDFSVLARDNEGDELSQLAGRLNRMAEQLQTQLQIRQELAALEERNRLARDLHDSVKQQIFATAMQVGTARALWERNPAEARLHLSEAEGLVRQAQQELTVLIQELRPAALEGKGLVTALRDYIDSWSRRSGITVEVRVQGERPLPLVLEQACFRMAQEALTNITRHSRADRVDVHLAWQGDEIILTIADNGRGFNVAVAAGKGLGLRSMRERMEAIGGKITFDSQPGRGTKVIARCWIPAEHSPADRPELAVDRR